MTTSATTTTDRSDFRHVMLSGTRLGAITAAAVVLFSVLAQLLPSGLGREAVLALVVLGAAALVSGLPGRWVASRSVEGIAGAAGVGLWASVVYSAIDIVIFRPFDHLRAVTHFSVYPWTWDAIGGLTTWWYLPVWWMLCTYVAWLGGLVTAARAAKGATSLAAVVAPVLAGAVLITVAARIAGCPLALPVNAGAGYTVTLTLLAILALARKA